LGAITVHLEAFLVKVEIQDDIPIIRRGNTEQEANQEPQREVHEITMPLWPPIITIRANHG